ncbi:MAG: integrase core domain-containing protein [Pirellulaceae bacterium]
MRDEFLAIEEFETLGAAKSLTRTWKEDYNSCRPHSSLAYRTPAAFAHACGAGA